MPDPAGEHRAPCDGHTWDQSCHRLVSGENYKRSPPNIRGCASDPVPAASLGRTRFAADSCHLARTDWAAPLTNSCHEGVLALIWRTPLSGFKETAAGPACAANWACPCRRPWWRPCAACTPSKGSSTSWRRRPWRRRAIRRRWRSPSAASWNNLGWLPGSARRGGSELSSASAIERKVVTGILLRACMERICLPGIYLDAVISRTTMLSFTSLSDQ